MMPPSMLGQLRDVGRDTLSLVYGQHFSYVSISFCLAPIDVSERLAVRANSKKCFGT